MGRIRIFHTLFWVSDYIMLLFKGKERIFSDIEFDAPF